MTQLTIVRSRDLYKTFSLAKVSLLFLCLFASAFTSCSFFDSSLDLIKERGDIVLLTRNVPQSYYQYQEKNMGFEYEIARAFADHLGVKLSVRAVPRHADLVPWLLSGKGDFIGAAFMPTKKLRSDIAFSDGYLTVDQKVVVRRHSHIKNIETLKQETVVVPKGSAFEESLIQLRQKKACFTITAVPLREIEDLLCSVSRGTIEATIAGPNMLKIYKRYYTNLHAPFSIGAKQPICWGVRKGSSNLLSEMNSFLQQARKSGLLDKIYYKYFGYIEPLNPTDIRHFKRTLAKQLPKYITAIKDEAVQNQLDWRLIVAQIYQESHFNNHAKSNTHVKGLMQFTRDTAKEMGVEDVWNPNYTIAGGIKYLKKLYDLFDEWDEFDRICVALASYNLGSGHILDAIKLAKTQGHNPYHWADLEKAVALLCRRDYYKGTTYGYCRGWEGVRYVRYVLNYYDILKQQSIEYPDKKLRIFDTFDKNKKFTPAVANQITPQSLPNSVPSETDEAFDSRDGRKESG